MAKSNSKWNVNCMPGMFAKEKGNANIQGSITKDNGFSFKHFGKGVHKLDLKLGKWRNSIDQKSILHGYG